MAQCLSPVQVTNPKFNGQDKMLDVRCGKCENCIRTLINDWSFRLEIEAKDHVNVDFITITYTPDSVPLTKTNLPTLSKEDVQKFWKRLRKLEKSKLKYFIVGEYGSNTYRPHYHAIVYGVSDSSNYEKAWKNGFVHIGDYFSNGAIRYTLKYMYKKGMIPVFDGDDRLPEFRLMSKKLGARYFNHGFKWHYADLERLNYVVLTNGWKQTMPRYYRKNFMKYIDEDKLFENLLKYEKSDINYQRKNQLIRNFYKDKNQLNRNKL